MIPAAWDSSASRHSVAEVKDFKHQSLFLVVQQGKWQLTDDVISGAETNFVFIVFFFPYAINNLRCMSKKEKEKLNNKQGHSQSM